MELSYLGRCTDAIACLRQTLDEGRKSSNVDIQLMLCNIQHCESIVQQLMISEKDVFYSSALSSLSGSLSLHSNILTKKICQINEDSVTKSKVIDTKVISTSNFIPTATHKDNHSLNTDLESKQVKGRQSIIDSTVVKSGLIRFGDVIGLTEAKCSLQDSIVMPLIFPHLFTGNMYICTKQPWKRILLFGPPGTGKSRLAQAVSSEVKATFYSVSSTDLMSSWMGESEKLVKELFHQASSQTGQSVIFIDEIDSLCRRRSSREDESTRRVKTELLIQMDGADRQGYDKLFLLCATNCPWELDTAFLRRFQKRIYIPLPDFTSRVQLMKLHCQGNKLDMSESDWIQLAKMTEGYSGSDLSTLTNGALFQPIRDMQTANYWRELPDGRWTPCETFNEKAIRAQILDLPPSLICPRDVRLSDFLRALQLHRPTVSKEELQKFEEFTVSFGQTG